RGEFPAQLSVDLIWAQMTEHGFERLPTRFHSLVGARLTGHLLEVGVYCNRCRVARRFELEVAEAALGEGTIGRTQGPPPDLSCFGVLARGSPLSAVLGEAHSIFSTCDA